MKLKFRRTAKPAVAKVEGTTQPKTNWGVTKSPTVSNEVSAGDTLRVRRAKARTQRRNYRLAKSEQKLRYNLANVAEHEKTARHAVWAGQIGQLGANIASSQGAAKIISATKSNTSESSLVTGGMTSTGTSRGSDEDSDEASGGRAVLGSNRG